MGGFGSGRRGGGPTVENTVKLDIDWMMGSGAIQPGCHVTGEMYFSLYDALIDVKFESETRNGAHGWLRLRYQMTDIWNGQEIEIDDKVYLETTRPHFGGLRWWFICPHQNRRVRALYLPLGGRHFWCRRAYGLDYASQRESEYDRAIRRARKLYHRLGGDPADDQYPEKPKGMRWTTYKLLMDKLLAADEVVDKRLAPLLALWLDE
jgi:hypothetical protein